MSVRYAGARHAGLTEDKVNAINDETSNLLSPRERAAVRYAEKLAVDHHKVDDTIVFMGSARVKSRETAEELVRKAKTPKDRERSQTALRMSVYYEAARELASRLTRWSSWTTDQLPLAVGGAMKWAASSALRFMPNSVSPKTVTCRQRAINLGSLVGHNGVGP